MKGNVNIDESTLLRALEEFDPDLYTAQFTLWGGNSLHFAAELGYTTLIEKILTRGYTKLLWVEDYDFWYPVQSAVEGENFGTAKVLLRHMKQR